MRNQYGLRVWTSIRKTLDNNDLNRVGRPAVLVKTRVWVGCLVSRSHKTWGAYHLTENFGNSGWKVNGRITFRKFQSEIEEYVLR